MIKFYSMLLAAFAALALYASDECQDSGVCKLPGDTAKNDFHVLSPVGKSSIKSVKQPPRLSTLKVKVAQPSLTLCDQFSRPEFWSR